MLKRHLTSSSWMQSPLATHLEGRVWVKPSFTALSRTRRVPVYLLQEKILDTRAES